MVGQTYGGQSNFSGQSYGYGGNQGYGGQGHARRHGRPELRLHYENQPFHNQGQMGSQGYIAQGRPPASGTMAARPSAARATWARATWVARASMGGQGCGGQGMGTWAGRGMGGQGYGSGQGVTRYGGQGFGQEHTGYGGGGYGQDYGNATVARASAATRATGRPDARPGLRRRPQRFGGRGQMGSQGDRHGRPGPAWAAGFEQGEQGFGRQGGMGQQGRGGWGAGGVHRGKGPMGCTRSDERIRESVCEALSDDDSIDASQIDVTVRGGEVILAGTVDDRQSKRLAEDVVERLRASRTCRTRSRSRSAAASTARSRRARSRRARSRPVRGRAGSQGQTPGGGGPHLPMLCRCRARRRRTRSRATSATGPDRGRFGLAFGALRCEASRQDEQSPSCLLLSSDRADRAARVARCRRRCVVGRTGRHAGCTPPRTMRYEDEEDPKKPHPVWGGRKGDNSAEDQEHGPDQVGPDGKEHDESLSPHARALLTRTPPSARLHPRADLGRGLRGCRLPTRRAPALHAPRAASRAVVASCAPYARRAL